MHEQQNKRKTLFVSSWREKKSKENDARRTNLLVTRKLVVKDYTVHNEYRFFN